MHAAWAQCVHSVGSAGHSTSAMVCVHTQKHTRTITHTQCAPRARAAHRVRGAVVLGPPKLRRRHLKRVFAVPRAALDLHVRVHLVAGGVPAACRGRAARASAQRRALPTAPRSVAQHSAAHELRSDAHRTAQRRAQRCTLPCAPHRKLCTCCRAPRAAAHSAHLSTMSYGCPVSASLFIHTTCDSAIFGKPI